MLKYFKLNEDATYQKLCISESNAYREIYSINACIREQKYLKSKTSAPALGN